MKRTEIAKLREEALVKFYLQFFAEKYSDAGIEKASNIVNRYYRICGACSRLLELENDEMTYNKKYVQELRAKTERAIEKLKNDLKKVNLIIIWYSHFPTITTEEGKNNAFDTYFYN